MQRLKRLKPSFWDHHNESDQDLYGLNFARKWKMIVFVTSLLALVPLVVIIVVEFNLTRAVVEKEAEANLVQLAGLAAYSVSFSDEPEKAAKALITRHLNTSGSDRFLASTSGVLLSDSFYYGPAGSRLDREPGFFKAESGHWQGTARSGTAVLAGFARIPSAPVLIVQARGRAETDQLWLAPRFKLMGYLLISVVVILLAVMGMATLLVGRIHRADQRRSEALHHAEYANKLASIGRLASGVAHEVNNPLAIINQKTGLIQDLIALDPDRVDPERLAPLTRDILEAVQRGGAITRQLLDFSRDMELSIQVVDIKAVIGRVVAFLAREADQKSIQVTVDIPRPIKGFECDQGCLQQIFLNLFNNAFAAMDSGGRLAVSVRLKEKKTVVIRVTDDGCGIAGRDLTRVFEPFYKSREDHHSTGMGLSITYGLVQEAGGDIRVKSTVGKGTCFTLTFPLKARNPQTQQDGEE